jgi:hypothetical protein
MQRYHTFGVIVQNSTQLLERSHFLRPFIWSRVPALMRFLTADQKQQRVNVCEELRQFASDTATFLSRVITGDNTGQEINLCPEVPYNLVRNTSF